MSEAIWCNVGFKVPATWGNKESPPQFVAEMGEALINGYTDWEVGEWIEPPRLVTLGDYWTIWSVDGEGNYGLYDSRVEPILKWAREHRIPYRATSDPKYEFSGEVHVFDGETEHERSGDGEGQIVLTKSEWAGLLYKHGEGPALVEAVKGFFGIPDLAGISIDHLIGTECPSYIEENE